MRTHMTTITGTPIALVLLLAAAPAHAGEATDAIKSTVDAVIAVLEDPALKGPSHTQARRSSIKGIVLKRFGFDEMARRSLGPDKGTPTATQRSEYTRLFTDLLARSYISRIEAYNGEPIRYDRESVNGDQAEVQSTVLGKAGDRTIIQYRLRRAGATWEVYDLVIDGVSLVNNYRIQFGRIIRQSGFAGLLEKMKSKLAAELESDRTG